MNRCVTLALALSAAVLSMPAPAQPVQRSFPAEALRGELRVHQPPEAELDGKPVRLAPGARIRGENNLLVMSGAVAGQTLAVHYTRDGHGLLKDIWVLSAGELARQPWPTTPEQAARWQFDPIGQRWSKP